ncbi:MAG TPA: lipoyl domain-containing protein [Ottowia sp.]|uniref:lipoyl domain-containing protein n=1 Tax=Ottowia sp. TaxID=1898956 RepID=UPI002CC16B3F|nr:lipoyl domain-containing protein [Ottowia sp.]HMN22613.1 lipoyl domain-containing protein [Ottowia sp.]
MSVEVTLPPEAWAGVEAGTEALVDKWHVKEGDPVRAGQLLASVVLVKTSHEILAPADGVVERILVASEDTFGPGQALARIAA